MAMKRIISDILTPADVAELRRLIKANIWKGLPLLVRNDGNHHASIGEARHFAPGSQSYLASGHMDTETAQLFAEAVNALPKLLDFWEAGREEPK